MGRSPPPPGHHRPSTKNLDFSLVFQGFWHFFRFCCDLSGTLDHHGLQDASKTSKIASKTLPRPPKTPPRGLQTPPRRPRSLPRRLEGCPTSFQMPSWRPKSPLNPSRRPPEASRCLPDAQYRFQDRPKCSEAFSKAYFPARFMPSPCQVPKYARDICPQLPSTMADCQVRGR